MGKAFGLTAGAIVAGAALLAGCTTVAPVRATRFHLGAPIERVAVAVAPAPGGPTGLEADLYQRAVAAELGRQGFLPQTTGAAEPLVAMVAWQRDVRELAPAQPPVTIGLGGGSFGRGFGGGGSVAFGVGRGRAREAYVTQLSVQLRRRPSNDVVWEGRAQIETRASDPEGQPDRVAARLAAALFTGFPGRSGETIIVK